VNDSVNSVKEAHTRDLSAPEDLSVHFHCTPALVFVHAGDVLKGEVEGNADCCRNAGRSRGRQAHPAERLFKGADNAISGVCDRPVEIEDDSAGA